MSKQKIKPFGMRDKIGYMFGDFGNDFTFIFASSFLMVFYTEVLGIPGKAVGTLFLVSRIIDAFTDVGMGRIVDRAKVNSEGKFKPWIRRIAGPVALASFLMYQGAMANQPMTLKMIYMYVTYILWGSVFYTAINIPYGSMASAISEDPAERTQLSTFRTLGATLASLVIGVGAPFILYTTNAAGDQVIRSQSIFTMVAGVFSVLAIVCYYICYKLTTERVKVDHSVSKTSLRESFTALMTNRSLIAIIFAAIFLLVAQLMVMSMNNYIYPVYFANAKGISYANLFAQLSVIFIVAPLGIRVAPKVGKREMSIVGSIIGAALYFVLFMLRLDRSSMYLYIVIATIAYMALAIFNTVIWAKIIDVIDDIEVKTHTRDDATVYAFYSFARKLGQALAGGVGGWALSYIGYQSGAASQTPEVLKGLYSVTTLVPACSFTVVTLILIFAYPLTKKRVEANTAELNRRLKQEEGGI